tara:strand:- start:743 stop:1222 length:480 start_codon:yes stop_codon:yes gene_type:complete
MIRTDEKRRFFTSEENYPQLIEFSRALGAEISLVEVQDNLNVMSLDELAPAICDTSYNMEPPDFKVVQIKIPRAGRPKKLSGRAKILQVASKIRAYIEAELLTGQTVYLREVMKRFKTFNLSKPAICNHIRRVRDDLESKGYEVEKVGAGKYRINPSSS